MVIYHISVGSLEPLKRSLRRLPPNVKFQPAANAEHGTAEKMKLRLYEIHVGQKIHRSSTERDKARIQENGRKTKR